MSQVSSFLNRNQAERASACATVCISQNLYIMESLYIFFYLFFFFTYYVLIAYFLCEIQLVSRSDIARGMNPIVKKEKANYY